MNARLRLAGLLFVLASTAFGQVYRSTDENGNPVFSDVPSQDAEQVKIAPINVMDAVRVSPPEGSQPEEERLPMTYKIAIVSPQAEQTFQNVREFPVSVSVEPPLAPGHQVAIMLNGEVRVRSDQLSTVVTDVDRGEHRVTAAVVDSGGKPITTSSEVVVYFHRRTVF